MGSSSPQPQTVTQSTSSKPWAQQIPYLAGKTDAKTGKTTTGVFPEAERLYNQGPSQFFPGQTYAPTDAATTAGLNAAEATANEILSGNINPESGVGRFVANSLAKTLPGVAAPYISAGRTGSGMFGRAIGEGVSGALSPLYLQAPDILAGVGAGREAIAQKPITEAVARYEYNQAAPWENLARYLGAVQGNYGGQSTTTGTQLAQQQNPWMQAAGLGIGGVGALGQTGAFGPAGWLTAMLSDARLKEDIKPVGKTYDGLPIYTYKYRWGGPTHMGVMAQDVLDVKPDAVSVAPINGNPFLAVDYERL